VKRLPFIVIVALVFSVPVCRSYAREPSIAETDYLVPVDEMIQSDYYALLRRKLFVTPAHFVRIVDLSAGDNEVVLAIYRVGSDHAHITYTRPAKLLWEVGGDSQSRFVKDPSVSVSRLDAPFPKALALSVVAALDHLLAECRAPMKTERVILDGRMVEFTVESGGHVARGLLDNYARGPKGQGLNRLTDLLELYCQRPASERPSIARRIHAEAAKLARYEIREQRPNRAMQRTAR
jgi:hypothetical protein